jgi:hypothetical protein
MTKGDSFPVPRFSFQPVVGKGSQTSNQKRVTSHFPV